MSLCKTRNFDLEIIDYFFLISFFFNIFMKHQLFEHVGNRHHQLKPTIRWSLSWANRKNLTVLLPSTKEHPGVREPLLLINVSKDTDSISFVAPCLLQVVQLFNHLIHYHMQQHTSCQPETHRVAVITGSCKAQDV